MGLYQKILTRFPRGNLSYVFAYGSSVKQQIGYENIGKQTNPIIDLIFCVRDPLGWHAENIYRHPSDYSLLHRMGPRFLMKYQEGFGAKIYFNTLVRLDELGVRIKYGVISREHLLEDLEEWRHLYVAGRLQKPVLELVPAMHNDPQMQAALIRNLKSAFHVALLLLPEHFTDHQLFMKITALSYNGDFRMIFGENKNKIQNIVNAQKSDFTQLYLPIMKQFNKYFAVYPTKNENCRNLNCQLYEQDKSYEAIEYHLRNLPLELCERLVNNSPFKGNYADIIKYLVTLKFLPKTVEASVNDIVRKSSITQTLKNIPSAGILKSIEYSYQKILKSLFAY